MAIIERWAGISLEYLHRLKYENPNHYFFIVTRYVALVEKESHDANKNAKKRKGKR